MDSKSSFCAGQRQRAIDLPFEPYESISPRVGSCEFSSFPSDINSTVRHRRYSQQFKHREIQQAMIRKGRESQLSKESKRSCHTSMIPTGRSQRWSGKCNLALSFRIITQSVIPHEFLEKHLEMMYKSAQFSEFTFNLDEIHSSVSLSTICVSAAIDVLTSLITIVNLIKSVLTSCDFSLHFKCIHPIRDKCQQPTFLC
jgi:hypothetical protein